MNPWELSTAEVPSHVDVAVIGAGPAGLQAARDVVQARPDVRVLVLEAGPEIGGRVATRVIGGFQVDRGFQVLNTAYPLVQEVLDLPALGLQPFLAGAAVRRGGRFNVVADPLRHPRLAASTMTAPLGSLAEKLRTAKLAISQRTASPAATDSADETTASLLARAGTGEFGDLMLAPFFRGVLLEHDLASSARKFRWLLHIFASGDSALPRDGMGAITRQLAARLPHASVRLGARVEQLERGADGNSAWRLRLADGTSISSDQVIVATEQSAARELVDPVAPRALPAPPAGAPEPTGTTFSFALPASPADRRAILLLGTGEDGPITNASMQSNVQASYAPAGRGLLQATVVPGEGIPTDIDQLAGQVRAQLTGWFGPTVAAWKLLHTDHLVACLPFAAPGKWGVEQPVELVDGLFVCGDHVDGGTLDGALRSARRAAAAANRRGAR